MDSPTALIVHGGYSHVELALLRNESIVDTCIIHKHQASRDLLSMIDLVLDRNELALQDCDFIAAHQGPGPFTTLRVVLATVNGLSFATGVPLVGVDGLDAFIHEQKKLFSTRYLAIVLNAFCDDVYFGFYDKKEESLVKGCESITTFIERLRELSRQALPLITLVGNGLDLHKELLHCELGDSITVSEPYPALCSLSSVAALATKLWFEKKTQKQLLPLYLKDSTAHLGSIVS